MTEDFSDYALWWPKANIWLTNTKWTLDQYGVQSDAQLSFTSMHKTVRLQLPDLRILSAQIDFSVTVFASVCKLCHELGKRNTHTADRSFTFVRRRNSSRRRIIVFTFSQSHERARTSNFAAPATSESRHVESTQFHGRFLGEQHLADVHVVHAGDAETPLDRPNRQTRDESFEIVEQFGSERRKSRSDAVHQRSNEKSTGATAEHRREM